MLGAPHPNCFPLSPLCFPALLTSTVLPHKTLHNSPLRPPSPPVRAEHQTQADRAPIAASSTQNSRPKHSARSDLSSLHTSISSTSFLFWNPVSICFVLVLFYNVLLLSVVECIYLYHRNETCHYERVAGFVTLLQENWYGVVWNISVLCRVQEEVLIALLTVLASALGYEQL